MIIRVRLGREVDRAGTQVQDDNGNQGNYGANSASEAGAKLNLREEGDVKRSGQDSRSMRPGRTKGIESG
jgi:hypothetical protein